MSLSTRRDLLQFPCGGTVFLGICARNVTELRALGEGEKG